MKTKSAIASAFMCKTSFIVIGTLVGFLGTISCDAQSIIGIWHRGDTKIFVLDKATGGQKALTPEQQKQFNEAARANEYKETLDFKPNNTYVSKVSAKGMAPTERTESYTLTGNKLEMNMAPVHGRKPTITIKSLDATTMIWDLTFEGKLTEIIYTKN